MENDIKMKGKPIPVEIGKFTKEDQIRIDEIRRIVRDELNKFKTELKGYDGSKTYKFNKSK